VDGELWDLTRDIENDSAVEIVTRTSEEGLELLRHDAAHALAEAVKELWPDTQVTIGPAIENGFYYDFSREEPFTENDLEVIEARMKEIVDRDETIEREVWNRDEAVEYFRGITNPIGIKIGPGMSREWLQSLVSVLNPNNEPGRLTLIHRFGAKSIEECLPDLITAVRETGSPVLWVCDPMHGNTESTAEGIKTRRFDNVIAELEAAFRVHDRMGTYLGGVHLELTGENVTECTGGARGLTDADLARAYKSTVDPRLNYEQAMEVAMRIAGL